MPKKSRLGRVTNRPAVPVIAEGIGVRLPSPPPTPVKEEEAAQPLDARSWARSEGFDVASSGPLPRHVREAFEAAQEESESEIEEAEWSSSSTSPGPSSASAGLSRSYGGEDVQ